MNLLAFILTSLIIELTPGPNMAYLAILSTTQGRRAGFSAVGGIAAGLLLIGLAASAGLATLIARYDFLYQGLRWAGILYLLWLAWDGWQKDRGISSGKVENFQATYFYRGLMTNVLNPKAILFYVAILPTFLDVNQNLIIQTVTLTFVYVSIATIIHSLIVVAAHTSRRFIITRNPVHIRRTSSLLLIFIAIWFAWKTSH